MPNFFSCICSTDKTTGKIYRRIEKSGAFHDEYTYSYDDAGHLKEVFRNDMLRESYTYNDKGQRTLRLNGWEDGVIRYKYDDNGCLLGMICINSRLFDYDEDGNLIRRRELVFRQPDKETKYFYQNTLLKGVILPDGTELVYTYDERGKNPVCPVAKYRNGKPVVQFVWKDIRHLETCVDVERGIRFDFTYKGGKLASIQLSRSGSGNGTDILSRLGGGTLLAFCDQVGTPKLYTNKAGRHIKEMSCDSFGVLDSDSLPELFIPIGFAGGLVDEDTGLVRFGFRDYDPSTGRFTCPDPARDMRGDGDLYDYCVDDPVSSFDPSGLYAAAILPYVAGAAMAVGPHLAQYGAAAARLSTTVPRAAAVGVMRLAPYAGAAQAAIRGKAGDAMKEAVKVAGEQYSKYKDAATDAAQRLDIAAQTTKTGAAVKAAGEFVGGAVNPNPALAPTFAEGLGTAVNLAIEEAKRISNKKQNEAP